MTGSKQESMMNKKMECLELLRALKNKDELSRSCKQWLEAVTANDKGVLENHSLNVGGGNRSRNGVSHASLQRQFTGKMSGSSLVGLSSAS